MSSRAGGQSYFYHFDGLGSTRAMTNSQAQLVEVYDYEAFGNELLSQGGLATPYRYVGQLGYYRHDDVELDLLGARYYAPEFGRLLTRDPLGASAQAYAYCESDPLNNVDPAGLVCNPCVCYYDHTELKREKTCTRWSLWAERFRHLTGALLRPFPSLSAMCFWDVFERRERTCTFRYTKYHYWNCTCPPYKRRTVVPEMYISGEPSWTETQGRIVKDVTFVQTGDPYHSEVVDAWAHCWANYIGPQLPMPIGTFYPGYNVPGHF